MLQHRMIFGPIMIAVLIGLVWCDHALDHVSLQHTLVGAWTGLDSPPGGLVLYALFLTTIGFGSRELIALLRAKGIDSSGRMIGLGGMVGCTLVYMAPLFSQNSHAMAGFATVVVIMFMASLLRHCWGGRTQGTMVAGAVTVFSLVYIGLLPGLYLAMRHHHSAWVIAAVILVAKSCDIGAYFTGMAIGKHKLIAWLSPKKTWEGLVGGMIFSGLIALLAGWIFNTLQQPPYGYELSGKWDQAGLIFRPSIFPLGWCFVVGMILGGVGQLGDLTASLFKRDAGIKDSGKSIPGFGGILDVVDSPIAVAPVAYWLLTLIHP